MIDSSTLRQKELDRLVDSWETYDIESKNKIIKDCISSFGSCVDDENQNKNTPFKPINPY